MERMWVSVKGSSMVKPAEETWNGCLPLSEWDQVGSMVHAAAIYFYKAPPQDWLTVLRDSLSRVLVHFYPMAGRFRSIGGGRLELLCNAEGAQLIEAESDAKLEDFGDDFQNLFPRVDHESPIQELPPLLVQLTEFSCGSISIAIAISHVIADGWSDFHFFNEWARLARGEPLGAAPFLDRMVLQNRSNINQAPTTIFDDDDIALMFGRPPLLIGQTSARVEREKPTKTETLKLTTNQVEALKKQAANCNQNGRGRGAKYSRYEVVTAHAWKCACKARRHKSAQPTAVGLCVDTRRRMVPPLPQSYLGNAIVDVMASSRSGEIVSKPLGFACSRIREAIERVTDDFVNAATHFLKNQSDLSRFRYEHLKGVATSDPEEECPFFGNPNIAVPSWVNLPIYGVDFGWGEEINMEPGYDDDFDGCFLLFPSRDGDGSILVSVCLQVPHMDAFKKFFYEDIHPIQFENELSNITSEISQICPVTSKL